MNETDTKFAFSILDRETFSNLFNLYYKDLCLYAYKALRRQDVCEDIVQEVFHNVWLKKESMDSFQNIKGYLFRSVHNMVLNHIKTKKEQTASLDDSAFFVTDRVEEKNILAIGEISEITNSTLLALPEKTRNIFKMSRNEGKTVKEIAAHFQLSEKAIGFHISKALKTLRISLKDYLPVILLCLIFIQNILGMYSFQLYLI